MAVSNGQPANQDTFNNAFMSKSVDSTTTGKVGLNRTGSGDPVVDVQQKLNDNTTAIAQNTSDISTMNTNFGSAISTLELKTQGFTSEIGHTIANNNVSPSIMADMYIDNTLNSAGRFLYTIKRQTSSGAVRSVGELWVGYHPLTGWSLDQVEHLQSSGVVFTIGSSDGIISYTSDNMAGTGYVGSINFFKRELFSIEV